MPYAGRLELGERQWSDDMWRRGCGRLAARGQQQRRQQEEVAVQQANGLLWSAVVHIDYDAELARPIMKTRATQIPITNRAIWT
jgi:hypothetical protein